MQCNMELGLVFEEKSERPRVPDYSAVYYGIEKDNIKNEVWCLKKNLNASRLSEHPTQGENVKTLS